ncbi:Elongation factor 1-gamma [Linnemannia exigua]|uniref:Elongation factor 1-gamma n=1 Tax=Linnemannia exigua TaxID=604196 RepID=A0AAD4HAQ9_9FUNG|nr:Elongation factor 1-gamma [Linnemannia exigua]
MTVGTIYSYPQNPRVFKALVVAKYNGLEVKVDDKFVMGTTNKTDAWIAKFGASQVPAFEGADGTVIIESGAIAYYRGSHPAVGPVRRLHLTPALSAWIYPILGYTPYNKASETAAIERTRAALATLERHLIKKTYLVGERVTLADIASASALFGGYKMVFDAPFRKEFPAVTRWFTTIVNQPHFKAVAGETVLCETQAKFTPPKKDTKEKKPKEEKPKEEKKPKAKEPEEEKEESFEDAPKPKSKLDLLPAAKMPLDEWKRQYSNNDTPVAMKWLWENIDLTTDYSIWKVDYKYNDELTKLYMSNNLAGGLMNRLERARKYAFGCLVVAGEDNANVITGYFIVRGVAEEMIEEITDAADYDSYNWVKVNVTDDEKKKIDQVFAWEGTIDGKAIADGKAFK